MAAWKACLNLGLCRTSFFATTASDLAQSYHGTILDKLSPELLRLIIEFVSLATSQAGKLATRAIGQLRLVNRRWSSIATPLLFEAIEIMPTKVSSNRACAIAASDKSYMVKSCNFVACVPDENRE